MSNRFAGYTTDEDLLLCQKYLDICQDPITGICQSRDQFWSRVFHAYNSAKEAVWEVPNKKSLQHRLAIIEKAVKETKWMCTSSGKFASEWCFRSRHSHTSKNFTNAKSKLPPKGFKFDHVWALMKDFEKFNDGNVEKKKKQDYANISSESEAPNDEDFPGDSTPSQRPCGVKKAKMKREINEGYMEMVQSENTRMVEAINNATERQKETNYIEKEKLRPKELKHEHKIMSTDVDSVLDPNRREYYRQDQERIIYKRSQQPQQSQPQQSFAPFTQYY